MDNRLLLSLSALALAGSLIFAQSRATARAAPAVPPMPRAPSGASTYEGILSVADAAYFEGAWYLADDLSPAVHVLSADGALSSFGSEGTGPGELHDVHRITATDGLVIVGQFERPVLSLFDLDGRFLRQVDLSGCGRSRVADMTAAAGRWFVLAECITREGTKSYAIHSGGADGTSSVLVEDALPRQRLDGSGAISFPMIAANPRTVAVGDGTERCLRVYRLAAPGDPDTRCLAGVRRAELPRYLRDRMQARSARLEVPDSMPVYTGLALLDDGSMLVQTIDAAQALTWRHVRSGMLESDAGVAIGRRAPLSFAAHREQLGVWEDEGGGVRLERIPIELVDR